MKARPSNLSWENGSGLFEIIRPGQPNLSMRGAERDLMGWLSAATRLYPVAAPGFCGGFFNP